MDGVLADFCGSPMFKTSDPVMTNPPRMYEEFFFETLPLVEGAAWAVRELLHLEKRKLIEVHILSQPVKFTHYSYSEKAAWVKKWFSELVNRLTLTQNKEHCAAPGRILIDDDHHGRWEELWQEWEGDFIKFDFKANNPEHNRGQWEAIIEDIKERVDPVDEPDHYDDLDFGEEEPTEDDVCDPHVIPAGDKDA